MNTTKIIEIQDKHNPIKKHVYVCETSLKGTYIFIWYRQHINDVWVKVSGQHSMGDLQYSNYPPTSHAINGYKEYFNQAMEIFNQ
tara:strand:+ start:159 stop:413 length:255 start_codon:yes stop_codon:yes gene_type:complete